MSVCGIQTGSWIRHLIAPGRLHLRNHLSAIDSDPLSICHFHGYRKYSERKASWYSENKALFEQNAVKVKASKAKTVDKGKKQKETVKKTGINKTRNDSVCVPEVKDAPITKDTQKDNDIKWEFLIMSSPFKSSASIDEEKQQQFKDYVEELHLRNLPSVGTVISKTQSAASTIALTRWRKNMTEELGGEEQFKEYHSNILVTGSNFHTCIQEYLLKGQIDTELLPRNEGHWESIGKVLKDIDEVVACEKEVVHPQLFYRGKYDCVAHYRGALCLIEWKTSSKPRPLLSNTYDNPIQVAAYIGAVNRSGMLSNQGVPEIVNGLLVMAYGNGNPATVHQMNEKVCNRYWKAWLERINQYWKSYVPSKKQSLEN